METVQESSESQIVLLKHEPGEVKMANGIRGVYLWKLNKSIEEYPEEGKNSLVSIVKKYIIDFFRIERGKNEELIGLTSDFFQTIRKFIRNIKIDEALFRQYVEEQFNSFHYEIINLQQQKSLEILKSIKNSFRFLPFIKRFLVKDLDLEYETQIFMTKITEMKSFVFQSFFALFISTFRDFIIDYSQTVEENIKEFIERTFNDFNHKFERALSKTKNQIQAYLNDIIESIKPVRLTLMMLEVPEKTRNLGPWLICCEKIVDSEKIELRQIVQLSESSLIISISFEESNRSTFIFNENHMISFCLNDILDSSTIICEGSSKNFLILIHNRIRKAYLAFQNENKLEAERQINVFSDNVQGVSSAVYLKQTKELAFVDQSGVLRFLSLGNTQTEKRDVVTTLYKSVHISSCRNFVLFLSKTGSFVFNNKLELLIQDSKRSDQACLTNSKLKMLRVNGEEIEISSVEISEDYASEKPLEDTLTEVVNFEFRNTVSFGLDIIDDLFEKKYFKKFDPPEINPK